MGLGSNRTQTLGLLLTFAGVAGFSLTLPMTRLALVEYEATQVAAWRAIIAAAIAIVILGVLRPPAPKGAQWVLVGLCAFGTVFGFPLFSTLGMKSVSASHGAVVVGLLPLATSACAVFIGGERPSTRFWLATLLGTMLTLIFVLRQAEGGAGLGHIWLALAVITASIGYAYGGLLSRTLPSWSVACWALIVSIPALIFVSFYIPALKITTMTAVSGLLYLALVSQLTAFFVFYHGLALAGIARSSQVQLLQTFLTIGFAASFFGEAWDIEAFAFGALVVLCVAVGTTARVA